MLNLTKTNITIGLTAPVKILHVTDIHITKANESDTKEHQELMRKRYTTFYEEGGRPELTPEEYFKEAVKLAENEGALLVCTGDAIDIHTHGNVECFLDLIDGVDMMFSPGGHEHQRVCVRTMEEPFPYVETVRPILESEFSRFDLSLESRVIGGLKVITADNSLDYFSKDTYERFVKELDEGLPTVVFFHDYLWDELLNKKAPYHENVRLSITDYETSHKMIDLLKNDARVVATFGGHGHVDVEREIAGKVHYMTAGLFKGKARLIEFT